MTNLYEFLRRIYHESTGMPPYTVTMTPDEITWLRQYLQAPDTHINFKAKATGAFQDGEPIMEMDFTMAGDGLELFTLICEATLRNPFFGSLILKAAAFYRDHVNSDCPHCYDKQTIPQRVDLNFVPHPNQ
jgi:hypothetical protein